MFVEISLLFLRGRENMTKDDIKALIDHSLFANLGFVDENGNPCIRRVFCTCHKGIGSHLISTNTSSQHIRNIQKNNHVCLYFEDSEKFIGCCFNGKAILHFDREYKEMLWDEEDKKYYSKGIDDEDFCVLEFISESGRYYRFDGTGNLSFEEITEYDKSQKYINLYPNFK